MIIFLKDKSWEILVKSLELILYLRIVSYFWLIIFKIFKYMYYKYKIDKWKRMLLWLLYGIFMFFKLVLVFLFGCFFELEFILIVRYLFIIK